jgi:tetratricopeptide (TPR) repeat protein
LLNTLLAERPDNAAALHVKAVLLNMQGQATEALLLMERSLQLESNDAGRWNDCGTVLAKLERSDAALTAYERSIALAGETPAAANAYNNRGRLRREMSPALAEQVFRCATELNPSFAQTRYNLSQVLPECGCVPEGVDAWARATVLAPQNAPPEHHARALVHLGRTKVAIALYRVWLKPGLICPAA